MRRKNMPRIAALLVISAVAMVTTAGGMADPKASKVDSTVRTSIVNATSGLSHKQVAGIIVQIQRADYEGDRAALKRLYDELAPEDKNKELAARVRYWRGFALWRRAINGFNDNTDPQELGADLKQAWEEFNESTNIEPNFVEAKIGAMSCVGLLAFSIKEKDPARIQELIVQARQLRKEIDAAAPDNPRYLWVWGPSLWYVPAERGGGQEKALATYDKGLAMIRTHKGATSDPLEPTWGEPELLMSLAWSNLNRSTPDLNAAEQNARAALAIVPYWHYVRDILLPQIEDAQKKKN
ncbi:MAG: hypothetical protein ACRD59_10770 [Candidatus Acidiferrales bacterium]